MRLGIVKSHVFSDSIILALKNDWMIANNGKPLEFKAKIEKNQLVLSAKLEALGRTKEVDNNEM
jgi:hypothetical protein